MHTPGVSEQYGNSLAMTSDDTQIVVGHFLGTMYFPTGPGDDSIALTSRGSYDFYVAAMNTDDSYFAWAQRAGGSGSDVGSSVAIAADGTLVVTGGFLGTAYFPTGPGDDSIALTGTGVYSNGFVAAMNADDSYFAWVQQTNGGLRTEALGVAIKEDGAPVITGRYNGAVSFPTGPADDSIILTSTGSNSSIFVAEMNADDSYFSWVQSSGSTGAIGDRGNAVAVTGDGMPIVTGHFSNTAYFPTGPGDDSIALTATAQWDVFVAAMNADDSYFAWAQRAGGTGRTNGSALAVSGSGAPIITGNFSGTAYFPTGPGDDSIALTTTDMDMYVAKMNADDSYFAWAQTAPTSYLSGSYGYGTSVAVTSDDSAPIVSGMFAGTAYFPTGPGDDSIALTDGGNGDAFIAAMNADDSYFAWAQRAGGTSSAQARSIALTRDDTVVVLGEFRGTSSFPTSDSTSVSLTAGGVWDSVFVGLLGSGGAPSPPAPPDPPVPPTPTPGPVLPPSPVLSVTGVAGDASAVISWSAPASTGSFPLTAYEAVLSPGERSCLVAAPMSTCSVAGLVNGTAYTATVRALNGAGWGARSAASNDFTPRASAAASITITGSRSGARITVSGSTVGFGMGGLVTPWSSKGRAAYASGRDVLVTMDGTVDWSRKANARSTWRVYFTGSDGVKSNTVTIR